MTSRGSFSALFCEDESEGEAEAPGWGQCHLDDIIFVHGYIARLSVVIAILPLLLTIVLVAVLPLVAPGLDASCSILLLASLSENV